MESLVKLNAPLVLTDSEGGDHFMKKIRVILQPANCQQVLRFWFQQMKNDQVVVRLVVKKSDERNSTVDDKLIGKTWNNISAIKVIIGNWASGQNMTGVAWQLYDNFQLLGILETGRFDEHDLWQYLESEDRLKLEQKGIYPKGDWDFDCIMQLAFCLNKHPLRDPDDLMTGRTCPECGILNIDESKIHRLLAKRRNRFINLPPNFVLNEPCPHQSIPIFTFVDLSTLVIFQQIIHFSKTGRDYVELLEFESLISSNERKMPAIFRILEESIFHYLSIHDNDLIVNGIRDEFNKIFADLDDDDLVILPVFWNRLAQHSAVFKDYLIGMKNTWETANSGDQIRYCTDALADFRKEAILLAFQVINVFFKYSEYLEQNINRLDEEEV